MTALREQASPPRRAFGWFFAVATAFVIAHGFGCHGDDLDREPGLPTVRESESTTK